MSMKVRQFNDDGLQEFRDYLAALKVDPKLEPPFDILEKYQYTTHVKGVAYVDNVPIPTRMDAAKYLTKALQNLDPDEYENNNMWAWLSLFFFDQICPLNASGKRKAGMEYRYIPAQGFRAHHRHLLKIPFGLFRAHGSSARLLLANRITHPGDLNEQIVSRQKLIGSQGVMETLASLYFDSKKESPKRGIIDKSSKKKGSLDRFQRILSQLVLTYDVESLSADELLGLLPPEFDSWSASTESCVERIVDNAE